MSRVIYNLNYFGYTKEQSENMFIIGGSGEGEGERERGRGGGRGRGGRKDRKWLPHMF